MFVKEIRVEKLRWRVCSALLSLLPITVVTFSLHLIWDHVTDNNVTFIFSVLLLISSSSSSSSQKLDDGGVDQDLTLSCTWCLVISSPDSPHGQSVRPLGIL